LPALNTSAYVNCETVLNRIRLILNDSEVPGGDVLTDTANFTFSLLNGAFERVQRELAIFGIETYATEGWLIGVPVPPTLDPECRVIISDTGCAIIYPNGVGNVYSLTPQLFPDLVVPLKLWERQSGTNSYTGPPMKQCNDGLLNMIQQTFLVDWQWLADGLYFRGALQVEDVKVRYEKQMPQVAAITDPVPIRGVTNAVAYAGAKIFCESRGGAIAPAFAKDADDELFLLKSISVRRGQRKQVRRRPYSGRGGRGQQPVI
jgi:hypothetical protein